MQKKLFATACTLGFLAMVGTLHAHELIAKPDKTRINKGENISVQVQAAHVFMVSEEAENPAITTLYLLQNNKRVDMPLTEDKKLLTLVGKTALPEAGPALLVAHRQPEIWSDTTEGVLEGNRQQLEAAGKKVIQVGQYEKFAKSLLNAHSKDELFKTKLNQPLEIILLTNPADLKNGGEVKAQVLLNGKPVATSLKATRDGYSTEGDAYITGADTNADGTATLKLDKAGLWMLRAEHSDTTKNATTDMRNLRAVYVFEVQ